MLKALKEMAARNDFSMVMPEPYYNQTVTLEAILDESGRALRHCGGFGPSVRHGRGTDGSLWIAYVLSFMMVHERIAVCKDCGSLIFRPYIYRHSG
jgi:hypothetical protein